MRLLCTFSKEPLSITSLSRPEYSKEFILSFITHIGLDGKDGIDGINGIDGIDGASPFIGTNGTWQIGDRDTGVSATPIAQHTNYDDFPLAGNESVLYIDRQANRSYRWNQADMHYYVVGSNYDDIVIINGGNAQNN